MPERLRLELGPGAAVEWELDALMRAADAADPSAPPTWELAGELDWSQTESLRLISGAAGETALAIAVVRPAGASDHGTDLVAAACVAREGTDAAEEALLSTEYDPDGRLRRLGVELWLAGGSGKRIAADRAGEAAVVQGGGVRREATPLTVRFDGAEGTGLHELLRRG